MVEEEISECSLVGLFGAKKAAKKITSKNEERKFNVRKENILGSGMLL